MHRVEGVRVRAREVGGGVGGVGIGGVEVEGVGLRVRVSEVQVGVGVGGVGFEGVGIGRVGSLVKFNMAAGHSEPRREIGFFLIWRSTLNCT